MSLLSFLKKPSVMIGLGLVGFIGTNILTAKATYKFIKEKEALKRDTTLKEDIVLGAKCYGGAVAAGAVSAGLIFGGSKTYATTQAALVSGYTLLNTKYKNYRDMALKTIGLDNFKEIDKKLVDEKQAEVNKFSKYLPDPHEGMMVIQDPFSDPKNPIYSEIPMEQYLEAKNEFLSLIAKNPRSDTIVTVNQWRELNGIDAHAIGKESKEAIWGEESGWSQEYLEDVSGHVWIDIHEEIRFDPKGTMYYYPIFSVEPCVGNSQRLQWL